MNDGSSSDHDLNSPKLGDENANPLITIIKESQQTLN